MTSGGLIKSSVQFTVGQIEEIDRLAADRGISRSAMVSDLVRRGLDAFRLEQARQQTAVPA